jgi:hypothetical protein
MYMRSSTLSFWEGRVREDYEKHPHLDPLPEREDAKEL